MMVSFTPKAIINIYLSTPYKSPFQLLRNLINGYLMSSIYRVGTLLIEVQCSVCPDNQN